MIEVDHRDRNSGLCSVSGDGRRTSLGFTFFGDPLRVDHLFDLAASGVLVPSSVPKTRKRDIVLS